MSQLFTGLREVLAADDSIPLPIVVFDNRADELDHRELAVVLQPDRTGRTARPMKATIADLIRSSRSSKGKSGATGNPSLCSMCSRSSIASAPVKIERPPPAFGAADPMWAGGLRWADVTEAKPATGFWFLRSR